MSPLIKPKKLFNRPNVRKGQAASTGSSSRENACMSYKGPDRDGYGDGSWRHNHGGQSGDHSVEEEMDKVFPKSQRKYSKKGEGGKSGGIHGNNESTELEEILNNSNGIAEIGVTNAKIQNMLDILQDTWKLRMASN